MISKSEFCSIIKRLADRIEKDDRLCDASNEIYAGSPMEELICELTGPYITLTVEALAAAVDDFYGYVEWWVFDNRCGAEELPVYVDGKKINIKTTEELYDIIMNKE